MWESAVVVVIFFLFIYFLMKYKMLLWNIVPVCSGPFPGLEFSIY